MTIDFATTAQVLSVLGGAAVVVRKFSELTTAVQAVAARLEEYIAEHKAERAKGEQTRERVARLEERVDVLER